MVNEPRKVTHKSAPLLKRKLQSTHKKIRIAKTTFFFFSSAFADLGSETAKHHRRKAVRQSKACCSASIHSCIHHLYCLSVLLLYFWTIQKREKYQSCAKDLSSKSFYIKKISRISNLLVLLSFLWVSPGANSSLPLPVEMWIFCFLPVPLCYLTLHCAAWMSLEISATGAPTALDFTSKELLKGLELACSWEGWGSCKPLLISFFTCLKTSAALLSSEDSRQRKPHGIPDKQAQGLPSYLLCFETLCRWTSKRDNESLALMGKLLSYIGHGS